LRRGEGNRIDAAIHAVQQPAAPITIAAGTPGGEIKEKKRKRKRDLTHREEGRKSRFNRY